MEGVQEFQDLGDLQVKIRPINGVGANGVARLIPDDDAGHVEALEKIRAVIDQHYGDRIDDLANDDEQVIIERVVLRSDDLPHIEYQLVEEMQTDE